MLLEPELRARLERLALQHRRRVRGMWSGGHRSVQLGESLDFADYREYFPGDDFRRIDYNLWARMGVVLIRLFEAEDELPVQIVIDTSRSMGFGEKFITAQKLAAAMAYLGLASGERIRIVTVPAEGSASLRSHWARHVGSWPVVERWIEDLTTEGGTDLPGAAHLLAAAGAHRGPVILVSDLLAAGWDQSIDLIGSIGGGAVVHLLSPTEISPDLSGDLSLRDAETRHEVPVSLDTAAADRYEARLRGFIDEASLRSRRAGMEYVFAVAGDEAVEAALKGLIEAGVAS
jgi:uncharacterized protein (DUF58 family)